MKHRQRIGLLHRWWIVAAMVVLSGLWSMPRAQAVPISQRELPPAHEATSSTPPPLPAQEPTPSPRPPPTSAAEPGQRVDSDAPPVPRRPSNPDAPATNTHIGVGYKVGNGLGFFGLDTVVAPAPHVGFDLQVSLITGKTTAGTCPAFLVHLRCPNVRSFVLRWGEPGKGAMGPALVVVLDPLVDGFAGVLQSVEPVRVQALVS